MERACLEDGARWCCERQRETPLTQTDVVPVDQVKDGVTYMLKTAG
jgi:hypothetical protein